MKGDDKFSQSATHPHNDDDGHPPPPAPHPAVRRAPDVPRPPGPPKSMSMPAVLPSQAVEEGEVPDAPISMKGMASALKAAASNRDLLGEEQDDGDWSD